MNNPVKHLRKQAEELTHSLTTRAMYGNAKAKRLLPLALKRYHRRKATERQAETRGRVIRFSPKKERQHAK